MTVHNILYTVAVKLQIIRWAQEEKAVAAIETVILFPVLLSLLMGCYDIGRGINVNQKTIAAAQIIGDLVARDRSVTFSSLQDIVEAGRLAFDPYASDSFGYDIVSVQFDEDGEPQVIWRVTQNAQQNDAAVESSTALGGPGDGVVIVTAVYNYEPYFMNFAVDDISMEEVAFLRGRRSSVVACDDCPG
jgi:Flp pilus assembly protein TadG